MVPIYKFTKKKLFLKNYFHLTLVIIFLLFIYYYVFYNEPVYLNILLVLPILLFIIAINQNITFYSDHMGLIDSSILAKTGLTWRYPFVKPFVIHYNEIIGVNINKEFLIIKLHNNISIKIKRNCYEEQLIEVLNQFNDKNT